MPLKVKVDSPKMVMMGKSIRQIWVNWECFVSRVRERINKNNLSKSFPDKTIYRNPFPIKQFIEILCDTLVLD